MLSVIITSWKEQNTIGRCIKSVADQYYSGIPDDFEIIQVSPDDETLKAGLKAAKDLKLSNSNFIQIKDPGKGKPFALGLAQKRAKGNIIIWTDGDTYFAKNAVRELLKPFENKRIGGVSGRPKSMDKRDNIFGYWGHLLSDAADHRRTRTLKRTQHGYYISKDTFFPMSGYIMATIKLPFNIPKNILSDDAYISYQLRNYGYEIGYARKAECFVKYPKSLKDYYKQKVRSIGGYSQLQKMNIFKRDKQSRNFIIELGYTFYVLKYAKNPKELLWSISLFPIRLLTWVMIFWEKTVLRSWMPEKGWERIESTK